MHILSGKLGEKIAIPKSQLSVSVIDIQGGSVRLGISAPSDVAVIRENQGVAPTSALADSTPDSLDFVSAELSNAAYQIALRSGPVESWIDLELGLWKELAATVTNLKAELSCVKR